MSAAKLSDFRPTAPLTLREISECFSESDPNVIRVPSVSPTPLIGRWADESFPLNSRQASEIVAEQLVQRQRSSIVFDENAPENGFLTFEDVDEMPVQEQPQGEEDDLHSCDNQSEFAEQLSVTQPSSLEDLPTPTHISRCYKYDPYNVNVGVDVIFCCYCDQCVALQSGSHGLSGSQTNGTTSPQSNYIDSANYLSQESFSDSMTPSSYSAQRSRQGPMPRSDQQYAASLMGEDEKSVASAAYHFVPSPTSGASTTATGPKPLGVTPDSDSFAARNSEREVSDWDAPTSAQPRAPRSTGFATHLNSQSTVVPPPRNFGASVASRPAPSRGPQLSSFMPPPPPPRIMTLVLDEEGNRQAAAVYFKVLSRWYHHVIEAQEFFVLPEDYCPPPNKDLYPFEEWSDRCSGWWYSHFEHRQKKPMLPPNRFVAHHSSQSSAPSFQVPAPRRALREH